MFSARYSKCLKRVVQIKRLFHIFIAIALLLGFSSCGKKESNNFLEINLNEKTPVQIMYRQNLYNGEICFDGARLELIVSNITEYEYSTNSNIVFYVDAMVCSVSHQGLEKAFQKEKLSEDFLPVIIYSFLSSTGNTFLTEFYEEQNSVFYLSRQVGQHKVTFQAKQNEDNCIYTVIIE